ncbi:MAG: YihY/virulence factor BrkB family protein [Lachnospiraceae bacterium]|nr:YihY/virulence factor BrkB family protein [Lachnospiraceae bacterium]
MGIVKKTKKESIVRSFFDMINCIFKTSIDHRLAVYSAQASFYILMSFFPILLLFLNSLKYIPIPDTLIPRLINHYAPNTLKSFLIQVFSELDHHSSKTIISVTAIFAIWAASRGALSIIFGMREIFEKDRYKNYFILRFFSMIYTVVLIISMVLTLVLLVFGNSIFKSLVSKYPALTFFNNFYTFSRYCIVFIILTLFFISIYKMGNRLYQFMDMLPGALFTSLGWMIYSYFFSIYVDNFSKYSYIYGSLTALIIIMLWMYFCMFIMFIGAEINLYIYSHNQPQNKNNE